jgi:hypothetical protein
MFKLFKYFIYVIFFPFTLTYLIIKQKWSVLAKVGAIAFLWIVVLGSASSSSRNQNSTPQTTTKELVSAPQISVSPTITPTKAPETLEDKITAMAQKTIDSKAKGQFVQDEQLAMATISDKDITFFDETSMVTSAWKYFVLFGRDASTLPEVKDVGVAVTTTLVDKYGKETEGNAVAIYMKKDEFAKFNWDNLKYLDITEHLKQSGDYYIQPSIYKKVKLDKLKLVF